jgi:septum formation topological specificity factor MinE
MKFFDLFKRREPQPGTAPIARQRLQVLLAH